MPPGNSRFQRPLQLCDKASSRPGRDKGDVVWSFHTAKLIQFPGLSFILRLSFLVLKRL